MCSHCRLTSTLKINNKLKSFCYSFSISIHFIKFNCFQRSPEIRLGTKFHHHKQPHSSTSNISLLNMTVKNRQTHWHYFLNFIVCLIIFLPILFVMILIIQPLPKRYILNKLGNEFGFQGSIRTLRRSYKHLTKIGFDHISKSFTKF